LIYLNYSGKSGNIHLETGENVNLTKLDERFFESTRGQIVMMLRMSPRTVSEIAQRLGVTDNAVRAHLLALERDGLVEHRGAVKGFRKPHYAYGLTDEARHLFPKPYAYVLNKLVGVLKRALPKKAVVETLRQLGRDLAGDGPHASDQPLNERLDEALKAIELLGGAAQVHKQNGHVVLKSQSCPFYEVVAEHPETCIAAESMIEQIVGLPVKETCERNGSPKCCFEIETKG
jgi:predicted ArsR family transcriptional regulator